MTIATAKTTPTIAQTIIAQLGGTLAMIGASNLMDVGNGLQMKVGRNPKRATHVTVTLQTNDTYTVVVQRVGRNWAVTDLAMVDGVYAETLADIIGEQTGLAVRL